MVFNGVLVSFEKGEYFGTEEFGVNGGNNWGFWDS